MKKLIIAALFTMFASAGAASSRADEVAIDAQRPAAVASDLDVDSEVGMHVGCDLGGDADAFAPGAAPSLDGQAQPFNEWCAAAHAACAADCMDLVGNAKGACLRMCLQDYKECMGL
jgi:hypothetical protein